MKTAQHLAKLYDIINKEMGPIEAKDSVSTAVYNIICFIHDEGLEVSPELIEKKLEAYVNDYEKAAKKNHVA